MNILFVVSRIQDWPCDIPGVTVIPAQTYLVNPACGDNSSTKVFNLCTTYRYQTHGYYVSLLADARGQQPLPDMEAVKDLHSNNLVQFVSEKLGYLINYSFACLAEDPDHCDPACRDAIDLHIYFGRDAEQRHRHLSEHLFRLLRIPVLHARFERADGCWRVCGVYAGSIRDIPAHHRECAMQAAIDYLKEQKIPCGAPPAGKPSLALLYDPLRAQSPSNPEALQKFRDAATLLGMTTEILTPHDTSRLTEFDALFIRDTTNANHYTYRLSRRAADAGMVVIDDPESILRCTDKIYLNELLTRHGVPTPKTMVVHKDNAARVASTLGLPCILKQPDGAFSCGVVKIGSEQELQAKVDELLQKSELVLAQEYLPTEFDWRVAVLDRRPLFVCKYYMAPGHWQVIKYEQQHMYEGKTEAMPVGEAPDEVVRIALQAAGLIGDGFYGVDLKQVGGQCYVIEINDNPNVDAGNEDAVLADALYREVMGVFRKRIDARRGNIAP